MDAALRRAIQERLRPDGFIGSYPHLRRRRPGQIDLITFQFNKYGGSFVVEIASCDPAGYVTHWGEQIDPSKVTALDVGHIRRPRLGDDFPTGTWFAFNWDDWPGDERRKMVLDQEHYDGIAMTVIDLVATQAEPYWRASSEGVNRS
jgi:hypothetical protein